MSQSSTAKDDLNNNSTKNQLSTKNTITNANRKTQRESQINTHSTDTDNNSNLTFKNEYLLEDILDFKKAQLLNSQQVEKFFNDKLFNN